MKEISRKIMGLAEVQIWISLNVYKGIKKKNDGLDLKYRFVFAEKLWVSAKVQIWISYNKERN